MRGILGKSSGLGGNFMVVGRDEFFAELDGLTETEIDARLDLWDQEQLALIQEYLDQRVLGRAKAEPPPQITAAPSAHDDPVMASLVEVASTANAKATAALILSVGAMLAAMASALVAFLALRGWTITW
jgi:phytoene/squalene synthetase